MKKGLTLLAAGTIAFAAVSLAVGSSNQGTTAVKAPVTGGMPITITAGKVVISAILNDTKAARDFAAKLPVTLPWFRNYGIEYITELSAPLTETGPFYTNVRPGDIVYYNPLDSVTIIYKETSSVPTLTKMGKITSDLSVFNTLPDKVSLLIEHKRN